MKHNYITYFKYFEGLLESETLVLIKKLQLDPGLDLSSIIVVKPCFDYVDNTRYGIARGFSITPMGKPCFGYIDYTRYGIDRGCPGMRPR
jgi:hypothetical protein